MKRFHFQLEGLLRVRRIEEERRLQELRTMRLEWTRLDKELDSLAEARAAETRRIAALRQGPISPEELMVSQRYLNGLRTQAAEIANRKHQLEPSLVEAQKGVQQAARAREIVELLKEKRYEEHLREVEKQFCDELDEVGRNRYLATIREEMQRA